MVAKVSTPAFPKTLSRETISGLKVRDKYSCFKPSISQSHVVPPSPGSAKGAQSSRAALARRKTKTPLPLLSFLLSPNGNSRARNCLHSALRNCLPAGPTYSAPHPAMPFDADASITNITAIRKDLDPLHAGSPHPRQTQNEIGARIQDALRDIATNCHSTYSPAERHEYCERLGTAVTELQGASV